MISVPSGSATVHDSSEPVALLPKGVGGLFFLISGLFFLWGIPNNLNDVLIRQFMKSFAITRFEAGLVQSAFYLGYFLLALPAGMLMRHKGYKAGFLTGLVLFASGCFLFYPAANSGKYAFFLTSLFVVASGLAFLETAANPFVAQLGSSATSEPRLNFAQAFNPVGAILGVLVGTKFIFSGVEHSAAEVSTMQADGTYAAYLHQETLRVVAPYLVLGVLALVWAAMIAVKKFPAFITARESSAEHSGNWADLLKQKHFLGACVAQFLYIGAQVGTWSYFIQYAQEYAHAPERTAGLLLTGTLCAFGVGRFGSAYLMRFVSPSLLMAGYAVANICLLGYGILRPGWSGLISILITSFFMSIMFPTIFALGLKDLGPNTNIGGSLLVMMIIGGAVMTPLMGLLAERLHSSAASYQLPLYGYVAVAIFALSMRKYQTRRAGLSTFEV